MQYQHFESSNILSENSQLTRKETLPTANYHQYSILSDIQMQLNFINIVLLLTLFVILFQSMTQREERSNITQTYHPIYRKADFKYLQLHKRNNSTPAELKNHRSTLSHDIINCFSQINVQLNHLEEFFRSRMDIHEQEILNIAHLEIKKIQAESQNVIKKYSKLIEERNLSKELLQLKYEIKFYQEKASEMFEQNRKLKEEIKRLRNEILMRKIGEQSDHIAMRNISKKYLKQKTIRKRLELSGLHRDSRDLLSANHKIFSYTSVVNPEHVSQVQKQLSLSLLKSNQQSKSALRNQFKLKLQKFDKNTRKIPTEPTSSHQQKIQI